MTVALDPAATGSYRDGGAHHVAGEALTTDDMITRYGEIVERFPVWSVEDALVESDWDGWGRLTAQRGDRIQLVGDDLRCTNPAIISEAISRKASNAALIKINQIGTVTETFEAMRVCREACLTGCPADFTTRPVDTGCGYAAP